MSLLDIDMTWKWFLYRYGDKFTYQPKVGGIFQQHTNNLPTLFTKLQPNSASKQKVRFNFFSDTVQ